MSVQEQAVTEIPVLTTIAEKAGSVEKDDSRQTSPSLSLQGATLALADNLDLDGDGAKAVHSSSLVSTLRSLPTPARNRNGAPARVAAKPLSKPSNAASRSPEPWDLPSPDAPAQQSSYRELLQVRGQQAMQRSRVRGIAPTPPPVAAARLAPIMEVPTTAVGNSSCPVPPMMPPNAWPCNFQLPPSVWFVDGAAPQPQAVQQFPVPSVLEQLCGAGADSSGAARAPVLAQLPCATMVPMACAAGGQDSVPVTPQARPSASPCDSPCTPQELMTTLIGSGAFSFDDQQIAEALRAAAPCVYDD